MKIETILRQYKTCKGIPLSKALALACGNDKSEQGASEIYDLAQELREYFKGCIYECLTENNSTTHIIAKDLLEKF